MGICQVTIENASILILLQPSPFNLNNFILLPRQAQPTGARRHRLPREVGQAEMALDGRQPSAHPSLLDPVQH